ncbi:hypothetical protein Rhe02_22910 [Rhizocola hellebori]|uniref:Uncharacterized protein n=1 Tax=Rhizocola hellebori TaxID=1392758 RepID=A0A8J3VE56_9ACTN|nr:hypothetical protein [Rhizocola hellebori]GIH04224.1 hypothetical protein Rhe02_22910 [Rhizocola hellebori]
MGIDVCELLAVIDEARVLLAQPDNDFTWASFRDTEAALSELDELAAKVRRDGEVPFMLTVLFAPTGPIQEVSLSSGWGSEFLALASRFDTALGVAKPV